MSGTSPEALAFHYDVGTDFYRLWLDPTLSYSCAMYDESGPSAAHADLHEAQQRKLHYALVESGALGSRRVLDVGCGWGGLLVAAVTGGAEHAIGLTLSNSHAAHVHSLGDARIGVAYSHFRDYRPSEPFDALCSIEAIEHFARQGSSDAERLTSYREFFAWCHSVLVPGARMYLQFSGFGGVGCNELLAFIEEEVFPESSLPRLSELCHSLESWFEITHLRSDHTDYVRTLNAWHSNLRRNREAAARLTSPATVARYLKYLGLSAISMKVGATTMLYRMSLRRIDRA